MVKVECKQSTDSFISSLHSKITTFEDRLCELLLISPFYSPSLAPWPLCSEKMPVLCEGAWSHHSSPPPWRREMRKVQRRRWLRLLKRRKECWLSLQSLTMRRCDWAKPLWRSDKLALMRRGAKTGPPREGCPVTHCKAPK